MDGTIVDPMHVQSYLLLPCNYLLKKVDFLLDPFEGEKLVEHGHVSSDAVLGQTHEP